MSIDRKALVEQLSEMTISGNENGLINLLDALYSLLPSNAWTTMTEKMLKTVPAEDRVELERHLVMASTKSCYALFHQLFSSSNAYRNLPNLDFTKHEDTVKTLCALVTSWGWANIDFKSLNPGKKLILTSSFYYEMEIKDRFRTEQPFAYTIQGFAAAIMDYLFGPAYPDGIGTFSCIQSKGIETGDEFAEFVVTKNP